MKILHPIIPIVEEIRLTVDKETLERVLALQEAEPEIKTWV